MTALTKTNNLRSAAAGDLNNDRIKCCDVCKTNGWPREPIMFEKIPGRVLGDGTNETKSWQVRDYFTGFEHIHKQKERADVLR
jgi:hypothetical protein